MNNLTPEDFNYELPPELIAQEPPPERTGSRLMVLDRNQQKIHHRSFPDLLEYLQPGDFLVFNDTRVIPARLYGQKEGTEGKVELLLLNMVGENTWEALVKPGKRVKPGHRLVFGDGMLKGEVVGRTDQGTRVIKFESDHFMDDLLNLGEVPLPPYIKKPIEDRDRYQTIFARYEGSSAAPTAGLHFTDEIFIKMKEKGIDWTYVTLHIGPGTFRPVKAERIEDHDMHSEFYRVTAESLNKIINAKKEGRRIIPVGTTATRTLESLFRDERLLDLETSDSLFHTGSSVLQNGNSNLLRNGNSASSTNFLPDYIYDSSGNLLHVEAWTDIFIYPGYEFKIADALITNFHLPKSTLIMLVSALAGMEFVLKAYREAVEEKYRFFSFGDCMLIV